METIKKIFKDIITNPDNLSYSAKRVGGFISLIVTVIFGALKFNEEMIIMAGLTTAFFGLSSIDNKTALQAGDNNGKNP